MFTRIRLLLLLLALCMTALMAQCANITLTPTPRGVEVDTSRYHAVVSDGYLSAFRNKFTGEEYLDQHAEMAAVLPHLAAGLGTQATDEEREAALHLYMTYPYSVTRPDLYLPNQHYPTVDSTLSVTDKEATAMTLSYQGLTDGQQRYPDEVFTLVVAVDAATGDLLLTPGGSSPRPGVYAASLLIPPLALGITAEAPIFDGVRLTRDMPPEMGINQWANAWDYEFLALNGSRTGAMAIWGQDAQMKYYKYLFFLVNEQGLSFSMPVMNIPPFDKLTTATPFTWHLQAFDKSWAQGAARFRAWRAAQVKFAPRPEWVKHVAFVNSGVNAGEGFLDEVKGFFGNEHLDRTVTFASCIRRKPFDTSHWDNLPYDGFAEQMKAWKDCGAKLMAYLQPMIMWGGSTPSAEDQKIIDMASAADTHSVFQKDPKGQVIYEEGHHLGDPAWQKWFLDWVHRYIADYGADGVYHDSSYGVPVDNRGLSVNGMTTMMGMQDYFYKAATRDPDSVHATEHLTEVNSIGASLGIGSGLNWGAPETMRHQRIDHPSPVSNALHYPNAVIFFFPHFSDFVSRGDSLHFHWGMDITEGRGDLPGIFIQNGIFQGNIVPFSQWVNEMWLDRQRALTFVDHGLRPVFPEDWDRNVLSYFTGEDGTQFRYEKTPWGSDFVQLTSEGKQMLYGRIHGVREAKVPGAVPGWICYNDAGVSRLRGDRYIINDAGPAGMHPDYYYCLDPNAKRPQVYFSANLMENYVQDGVATGSFALLRLRPVEAVGDVEHRENITFHSPTKPLKIYVNGVEQPVQAATAPDTGYAISFNAPADICVILANPQPGFQDMTAVSAQRMVSKPLHSDIFAADWVKAQWREQPLMSNTAGKTLPTLVAPQALADAIPTKSFQTHVLVSPPADVKEGAEGDVLVWTDGGIIDEFAINGVAQDVPKHRAGAGPLIAHLKGGQSAVLSITSDRPLNYAFEWVAEKK